MSLHGGDRMFEEVVEVLEKVYAEGGTPGIFPDVILATSGVWKEFPWSLKPISQSKFLDVVDAVLDRARASGRATTFKSLRCWLPTLGNVLDLDDSQAQSLSNWQEVPQGAGGQGKRGRASFPMARRYASNVIEKAAWLKTDMFVEFFKFAKDWEEFGERDTDGFMKKDSWSWSHLQGQFEVAAAKSRGSQASWGLGPSGQQVEPKMTEETGVRATKKTASSSQSGKKAKQSSSSSSSTSSEEEAAAENQIMTEIDGSPLRWFHIGGRIHFTIVEDQGRPVPLCRWKTCCEPFAKDPVEKGVGLTAEVAKRGICSSCIKAGYHRDVSDGVDQACLTQAQLDLS